MKEFFLKARQLFSNRVFSRLLLYYFVLTIIFASVCGVSYTQARNLSVSHIIDRNGIIFENSTFSLRNASEAIETFTASLSNESCLMRLAQSALRPQNQIYDIYAATQSLPDFQDSSRLVDGYFVYLPSIDSIVAPKQGFANIRSYYESCFALDPLQTYDSWHDEILNSTFRSLHASWQNHSPIQYVVPLNSASTGSPAVRIIYRINANQLLEQMTRAFSDDLECAVVTDTSGAVLAVKGGNDALVASLEGMQFGRASDVTDFFLDGSKYMLSYSTVSELGARLMILIPYSVITAQSFAAIRGALMVLVWLLVIGLLLIVTALLSWLIPLIHIADHVTHTDAEGSGLWLVSNAFDQMKQNQVSMEQLISEQKSHLRSTCVNRLIHGDGSDPYHLEELLRYSELSIHGSRYRGVLIELRNAQPEDISRTRILELLRQYSEHLAFLSYESLDTVAYLYSQGDDDEVDPRDFFTCVYETLKTISGMEIALYVGVLCDQLEQINESFSTAAWQMRISQHHEWLRIAEENPHPLDLRAILSPDEEKRLENLVMTGESAAVSDMLERLYRRNFVESNIQGFGRQFLYCRLVGLLATCNAALAEEDSLPTQMLQMAGCEFFQWLSDQFAQCCTLASARSSQRSQRLIDDVSKYIEEHYAEYDLSLNSLALHFGITGNYLSGLFKKQLGMNFSVYLEQARILHAEQLLSETTQTIDEIAQQVGYANADSFRRAFRRSRNVSPSHYRTVNAK